MLITHLYLALINYPYRFTIPLVLLRGFFMNKWLVFYFWGLVVMFNGSITATVQYVTLSSGHKIWTKTSQQGTIPLLLVHGGAGMTHECFEDYEAFVAPHGFKTIMYDQLDSLNSEKTNDPSLWTIKRFVQEIDEVRAGLDLGQIYLLGDSWGALLSIEYALAYPQHLKGVIFQGFPASTASFETRMRSLRGMLSAEAQKIFEECEKRGEVWSSEWMKAWAEFKINNLCRLIPTPEPLQRSSIHMNMNVRFHFFGKNPFTVDGIIKDWNRWNDITKIKAPSLVIAGEYDVCDPDDARKMALRMNASVAIIKNASHVAYYENQKDYYDALIGFLKELEKKTDVG